VRDRKQADPLNPRRLAYPVSPKRNYHGAPAIPLGAVTTPATTTPGTTTAVPTPTGGSSWQPVDFAIVGALAVGAVGLGGVIFTEGSSTWAKVMSALGAASAAALLSYASSSAPASATTTTTTSGVLAGRYWTVGRIKWKGVNR